MASPFKKRVVSPERVAAVESLSASVPIVGDPRMQVEPPQTPVHASIGGDAAADKVGARQDLRSQYQVGQVYDVPIAKIRSNPVNPRAIYTASAVDQMAMSLAEKGQKISATGYYDGEDDVVVLIEGETRFRGAVQNNWKTLRIEIRPEPENDQALYEEARAANVERKDQTHIDDAIRWKELLSKGVYPSQVALAGALKLAPDFVSRVLALAGMPSRILQAICEYPELLGFRVLNAIREYWEVKGDEDTLELVIEAAKSGLSYREITARRKSAEKGATKRPRSYRESLSYAGAKGELKAFEESGRLELKIKGLTEEGAKELKEKLLELFNPKEN